VQTRFLAVALARVALFAGLGPLVGLLSFAGVMAAWRGVGLIWGMIVTVVLGFSYPQVVPLSYAYGWKPAVLTGIVVATAIPLIAARKRLYGLAVAVGALASLVLVLWDWGEGPTRLVMLVSVGGAGAAAAAACTWLALRLRASGVAAEAG
jgi:hypothetical protein